MAHGLFRFDRCKPETESNEKVEPLKRFLLKLTLAQKVLLMYNNTRIRRHSCVSMMGAEIGHLTQALFSQVPFYQAFDWEFIVDYKDRYLWFELQ